MKRGIGTKTFDRLMKQMTSGQGLSSKDRKQMNSDKLKPTKIGSAKGLSLCTIKHMHD